MQFQVYFKIFILFGFVIRKSYAPSVSITIRFRNTEDGKVMVMLVTDRMVSLANKEYFHNFVKEWEKEYRGKKLSADDLTRRISIMFDSERKLTLKPEQFEKGMEGAPPKVQLAGHGKNQIGIAFTGHGGTLRELARKLRRKRKNPLRDMVEYNSMAAVAKSLEEAHRLTERVTGIEQGKQTHFGAKGEHIYSATIGRNKQNARGQWVPDEVEVRNLKGHLYSAGWNEEAVRYLEKYFGPANKMNSRTPWEETVRMYSLDEAKQHVRNAMRLNARHSAEQGAFSVTENFDSYIFSENRRPIYWEHDPQIEPMIRQRMENKVGPVEMAKKLLERGLWIHDDIPGGFKLTEEQKEWKRLAMQELQREWRRQDEGTSGGMMRARSGAISRSARRHRPAALPNPHNLEPFRYTHSHSHRRQTMRDRRMGKTGEWREPASRGVRPPPSPPNVPRGG